MKSETYLSAKITDDDRFKVDVNGTADEVLALLVDLTVSIFKSFEENGCSYTMSLFRLFFKNVCKEVFDIDL